jgi:hypothetical protein
VGPGYRQPTPYPIAFLERLSAAWRGGALVEDLLVSEEPGRLAARLAALLKGIPRTGRLLHWGAATGSATVGLVRQGFSRIESYDSNPAYLPLRRERLLHAFATSEARCIEAVDLRADYDVVLVVGDPACRPSVPREEEIASAAFLLRSGGALCLAAWGPDRPIPRQIEAWPRAAIPLRWISRARCRTPRGRARTSFSRWVAGLALEPAAALVPRAVLGAFGERYERWTRP